MAPNRPLVAALLTTAAFAATGCGPGGGTDQPAPPAPASTPAPPPACKDQPVGVARDGVNDEQGGSTPGVDPCDGPGN